MKRNVKNPEKKSATNMLTKLLSNTLASKMNCEGGNGKIGFKTLKNCTICLKVITNTPHLLLLFLYKKVEHILY